MNKERYFKHEGILHRVDQAGNHFINTDNGWRCCNPLKDEGNIGDSIPTEGVYDEGIPLKYTVKNPL